MGTPSAGIQPRLAPEEHAQKLVSGRDSEWQPEGDPRSGHLGGLLDSGDSTVRDEVEEERGGAAAVASAAADQARKLTVRWQQCADIACGATGTVQDALAEVMEELAALKRQVGEDRMQRRAAGVAVRAALGFVQAASGSSSPCEARLHEEVNQAVTEAQAVCSDEWHARECGGLGLSPPLEELGTTVAVELGVKLQVMRAEFDRRITALSTSVPHGRSPDADPQYEWMRGEVEQLRQKLGRIEGRLDVSASCLEVLVNDRLDSCEASLIGIGVNGEVSKEAHRVASWLSAKLRGSQKRASAESISESKVEAMIRKAVDAINSDVKACGVLCAEMESARKDSETILNSRVTKHESRLDAVEAKLSAHLPSPKREGSDVEALTVLLQEQRKEAAHTAQHVQTICVEVARQAEQVWQLGRFVNSQAERQEAQQRELMGTLQNSVKAIIENERRVSTSSTSTCPGGTASSIADSTDGSAVAPAPPPSGNGAPGCLGSASPASSITPGVSTVPGGVYPPMSPSPEANPLPGRGCPPTVASPPEVRAALSPHHLCLEAPPESDRILYTPRRAASPLPRARETSLRSTSPVFVPEAIGPSTQLPEALQFRASPPPSPSASCSVLNSCHNAVSRQQSQQSQMLSRQLASTLPTYRSTPEAQAVPQRSSPVQALRPQSPLGMQASPASAQRLLQSTTVPIHVGQEHPQLREAPSPYDPPSRASSVGRRRISLVGESTRPRRAL